MKKYVAILILGLLLDANSYAQTYDDWQWPSATISTDKGTYELYEPIIVTFTVTNTDAASHSYSEPTSMPGIWFWTLTAPNGEEVSRHRYDVGEVRLPPPPFASGKITYQPGVSRSVNFLMQASWPTWDESGVYTLSVATYDPNDRSDQQELASVQFEVLAASIPAGVEDTLRLIDNHYAFRYGYSGDPSIFDAISAAEALQDRPDVPDHVEEWALIAAAFSEGLRCADCASAQALYDAFLTEHASSGYAIVAEGGAREMVLSRGETHPAAVFDRYAEVWLKVFLEGAYVGPYGETETGWTSFTPVMKTKMLEGNGPGDNRTPYSASPWNQRPQTGDGTGTDWVLVSLLDSQWNIVGQRVAVVGRHGQVRAHVYNPASNGPYRIVVDHRNHIVVASDTLVSFRGPLLLHDFTTGHAYGLRPQKIIETSPDTVYAMWAGDGNGDGIVTAPDFNLWNAATTAGATGYEPADYNLDVNVTAPDFNLWIANTTAGAATGFSDQVADMVIPRNSGSGQQQLQSLSSGSGSRIRLDALKDTPHDYWLNVQAKADSSSLPANTIASIVVDIFFNDAELTYRSENSPLRSGGDYVRSVQQLEKDGNTFLRITYRASSQGYPWQDLGTNWTTVSQIFFDRSPPKRDPGLSIRSRTVTIGFYDSHANSNGSKRVNETIPEIQ